MPADYHISWMTPKQAEAHERRVHSIPAAVGLGWMPYTIRVTYKACSYYACHRPAELRRWLRQKGLRLVLTGRFAEHGIGNRTGYLVPVNRER